MCRMDWREQERKIPAQRPSGLQSQRCRELDKPEMSFGPTEASVRLDFVFSVTSILMVGL